MECKCESCGAAIADDDKFCPECGAKQEQACWSCGAALEAGATFCGECGERVKVALVNTDDDSPVQNLRTDEKSTEHLYYLSDDDFDGPVEVDPLHNQAVAYVLKSRGASISSLQRELQVGYNRSARMIDDMERAGLVSPMHSDGSRDVLVSWADYTKSNGSDINESGVKSFLGRLFGK